MRKSAKEGNLEDVKKYIQKGANINGRGKNKETALMLAIKNGHKDVVDFLLNLKGEQEIDPNQQNDLGQTAAMLAFSMRQPEIVRKIAGLPKFNPHIKNYYGETLGSLIDWKIEEALNKENFQEVEKLLLDYQNLTFTPQKILRNFVEKNHLISMAINNDSKQLALVKKQKRMEFLKFLIEKINIDPNYQDNEKSWTAAMAAASYRQSEIFQLIASHKDFNPNVQNNTGLTAAMLAIQYGNSESAQLIAQHKKFDPNLQDKDGWTAAMFAAQKDQPEIINLITHHKDFNPNVQNEDGLTATMLAAKHGRPISAQFIAQHKNFDPNLQDKDGWTAAMFAAANGQPNTVQFIAQHMNFNPNVKSKFGWTTAMIAAKHGQPEAAMQIAAHPQFNPNLKTISGNTLSSLINDKIDEAFQEDNFQEVKKLLLGYKTLIGPSGKNFRIFIRNEFNSNDFDREKNKERIAFLKFLSENFHVDLNVDSNKQVWEMGRTIDASITRYRHPETASQIDPSPQFKPNQETVDKKKLDPSIEKKIIENLNQRDFQKAREHLLKYQDLIPSPQNLAKMAINKIVNFLDSNGHNSEEKEQIRIKVKEGIQFLKLLIEKYNIDPNLQDNEKGITAAMLAILFGEPETAQFIVRHKNFDPNVQDKEGFTVAMSAVNSGQQETAQLIARHKNFNPNLQNKVGWTAAMYAARYGQPKTAQLIAIHKDFNPNLQQKEGWTAAMLATRHGQSKTAQLIANHKDFNPNLQNKVGWTAAMCAARYGQPKTAQLIAVHKDFNPNLQQKDGLTTAMVAAEYGQPDTAQLIALLMDPNINQESIRQLLQNQSLGVLSNYFFHHPLKNQVTDWIKTELENITDPAIAHKASKFFLKEREILGLYEEHPLIQTSIRIFTLSGDESNKTKGPYSVFKKLNELRQRPLRVKELGKRMKGEEMLCLNYNLLKKLQQNLINREDLPREVTAEVFSAMVNSTKGHVARLANDEIKKRYQQYLNSFDSPFFSTYLKESTGFPSDLEIEMRMISQYIFDQKDELEEKGISQRDQGIITLGSFTETCITGKENGVHQMYETLEDKYKLVRNILPANFTTKKAHEDEDHYQTRLNANKFFYNKIYQSIYRFLKGIFDGQGPFVKDLLHIPQGKSVEQSPHQSTYLKNLIGGDVGLSSILNFDQHTGTLYDQILTYDREEVFSKFTDNYFNPSTVIENTKTAFNDLIIPSGNEEHKAAQLTNYNRFLHFLSGLDIAPQDVFDFNEEGHAVLTEDGTKIILEKLNFIEKGDQCRDEEL